jgi:hypothetical protein
MAKPSTNSEKAQPPDFDPIVQVWRQSGIWYLSLGLAIMLFGCSLLVVAMVDGKADDFAQITKIAGGLITITSLQLFNMGRKRFERIGIVKTLHLRWHDLAASEGSERQIAELNRMVLKLFRDNLSRAF